ncbi:MAG TPA: glycosyltransferase family 39 protein, partial [Candidatus Dormibacteraeota bacterium]|nr:glycosyltransferase family 39 protein [Candidatus Dormibacteraeota bacterium]
MGSRKDRSWTALVISLLGVCFFAGLESIGLVGPDEPRYAWIARAMARTGDWITPRLWGHAWFEKPILYYWSAAAWFRLVGPGDRAARLPSAMGALAGALLLAWAAWRLYGSGPAKLVLVIFPTTLGLFAFAHAATMDMLLTVSVEAAMVAALFTVGWPSATREDAANAKTWPLLATGAFIGLGTLAKGPVSILLAGGSVLLWAALTRRWHDALRFLRWEPLAAFAVVAVPWYAACSIANPSFPHAFLWHQNVQRFLTPVFEHVRPWWFFFPVLILGLLPWTATLLPAARDGWKMFRDGRAARSPGLFVACWAAFPLLFFSFSDSKLPGYILPALPPLVFLMARTIDRGAAGPHAREKSFRGLDRWAIALVGLTWVALSVTAGHWLRRLPKTWDISHRDLILGVLAATATVGAIVILLGLTGRVRRAVGLSALSMGVLVAAVAWVFMPQVDPYLSARHAAQAVRQAAGPSAIIEDYRLPR